MSKSNETKVTLEKVADALRTEGHIAGQIAQATRQGEQNVAAINKLEKEALAAIHSTALPTGRELLQAIETIQALAKGCRDNATACAKAAETQMPLLKQRQKLSNTLMEALKPAIQGKRGADLGRRVLAAVKAFKG